MPIGDEILDLIHLLNPLSDQAIGQLFTNVQKPYSRKFRPTPKQVGSGLIDLATGNDTPQWDINENPDLFASRDYLGKAGTKGVGLDDPKANRYGGAKFFDKVDDKTVKIKTDTPFGKEVQGQTDEAMTAYTNALIRGGDVYKSVPSWNNFTPDKEVKMDNKDASRKELLDRFNWVMGSYILNPQFQGEGQDDKGYYNLIGGKDSYDFGLNKGESLFANFPVNLGRAFVDKSMDPIDVEFQSKVYLPGYKKQNKKSARYGAVPNPDD